MSDGNQRTRYKALTIAGSDSGGGAGIQADLKTFAAFGVYGTSVITAVTAQNTLSVDAVQEIDGDVIAKQIDAVMGDIGAHAVKTGMISSSSIIEVVAAGIQRHSISKLVVDPVMVSASGSRLLREDAVDALKSMLIPLSMVVTPNIPEAEVLTGLVIDNRASVERAARDIHDLGARYVIIKGGHGSGEDSIDVLFDGGKFHEFSAVRMDTQNTHGTGCTFSSAIASGLAKGDEVHAAVQAAKEYVTEAIRYAYPIGQGHGPLNHFYAYE
ncbi:MAG: bifunctional hydroxymethylpyrimidine kinase/phosphomethylpyrimidine kinase [Chloroflexi bacterium]|nr:bifunctional hydroxymethylpyrimidine kinase/phosphomethylpyrimidine kinase [Chloroflexota bacterium]